MFDNESGQLRQTGHFIWRRPALHLACISQYGSATLAAAVLGPELQMNCAVSQLGLIVSSLFFSVVQWRNDGYSGAELPKE